MSEFNEKEFDHLAKLCRLEFSKEEKQKLGSHLNRILGYVKQLHELDTENVKPCKHVLETMANVMREDIPGDLLNREEFLANVPSHVGGMVRVPPVIKIQS
jgi:aspartyl-tRNA(Asn)/glutamyl-tRNA(Gln) amidotransferase subunit C